MIYITGDTHIPVDIHKLASANFPDKDLVKNDYVIICGDFGGVWNLSREDIYWQEWLEHKNFTTLFVDGNHENFDLLAQYPKEEWHGGIVQRIKPSLLHLCRGEVFHIDGCKIFAMGGAASHDTQYRVEGVSWWKQEMPSLDEMNHAVDTLDRNNWDVDYIITHCTSTHAQQMVSKYYEQDYMTRFLEFIDNRCQYKDWFFGHYHIDKDFEHYHAMYNRILRVW